MKKMAWVSATGDLGQVSSGRFASLGKSAFALALAAQCLSLASCGGARPGSEAVTQENPSPRDLGSVESVKLLGHDARVRAVAAHFSSRPEVEAYTRELWSILQTINETRRGEGAAPVSLDLYGFEDDEGEFEAVFADRAAGLNFVPTPLETNSWAQDIGEIVMARFQGRTEAEPLFVNHNKADAAGGVPEFLSHHWLIPMVKFEKETTVRSAGGNLEVTPNDVLYYGDTFEPEAIGFYLKRGYQHSSVVLETHWLSVGHVDEMVSTIAWEGDPCGFAIVKSDPRLGLELLKASTEADFDAIPDEDRIWEPGDRDAEMPGGFPDLINVWKLQHGAAVQNPVGPRALLKGQEIIARKIDANVARLVEAVQAKSPACRNVKVISSPVLYDCSLYGDTASGRVESCRSLISNATNMLVVGKDLIIGDPKVTTFRNNISATYEAQGQRVHFIDSYHGYSLNGGDVHCSTNVLRAPRLP